MLAGGRFQHNFLRADTFDFYRQQRGNGVEHVIQLFGAETAVDP